MVIFPFVDSLRRSYIHLIRSLPSFHGKQCYQLGQALFHWPLQPEYGLRHSLTFFHFKGLDWFSWNGCVPMMLLLPLGLFEHGFIFQIEK